ncbi:conjugal transfer ATP-binding protein TraC [Mycoplasmopsis columboralis]|uniref:Conjugal transfer ATP-binding protein TraC n=1 Tax=Mycoplasmopsis columboralis TaxID=171282 RepID=A0A449B6R4_9BACT|nr:DUF87 domain-containing protein [Mycoplasmopsis columboralis]VEU76245.1 conjugal transfer ATP-binding protein TraC [Mycoplasmopsis columboralis]
MKLQTNKLRKYKQFSLRGLNVIDITILISVILITVFAVHQIGSLITKLVVGVIIVSLGGLLILKEPKHKTRIYLVIYRMLVHLLRQKLFTKNKLGNFNTKTLLNLKNFEDNFLKLSLSKDNTSYALALEVFGKDITINKFEEQEVYYQKLTQAFANLNDKIFIVKIPEFVSLEENIKSLETLKVDENMQALKNAWKSDLETLDTYEKVDKYYVVMVSSNKNELYHGIKNLQARLFQTEIFSKMLSKLDFLKMLNKVYRFGNEFSEEELIDMLDKNNLNEIFAFDKVLFKKNYFKTDNVFNSIQTISEYPLRLKQSWIIDTFKSNSMIIWSLNPVSEKHKERILNRAEQNLEEIKEEVQNRYKKRKITKDQDALNELSESLVSGEDQLFESSFILVNRAFNLEDLKAQQKENEENIKSWKGVVNNLKYRQFDAYSAMLFKNTDMLKEYTEQLSTNIGFAWVFHNQYFNDKFFSIIGNSNYNGNSPIFFDQGINNGRRNNFNMFILGTSGSGKSTFAKKLIAPKIAKKDKVIVLDPQSEYSKSLMQLGAVKINLGTNADVAFNPLQIRKIFNPDSSLSILTRNSELLTLNENALMKWFKIIYPHFNEDHIILLRSAIRKVWEKHFKDIDQDLSTLSNDQYPIMSDLINELEEEEPSPEISKVLKHLKVDFQEKGQYYHLYNKTTNVDLSSNAIIFDTSALMKSSSELFNGAFYLIISFIQGLISNRENKDNSKIWILIDEAHMFIDERNESTLDFIFTTVKEGRKFNCGTIITTQNPQDFTKTQNIIQKGQAILENCQYSVLLKCKSETINEINKLFKNSGGLSELEQNFLAFASVGQGILIVDSSEKIAFDAYYNQEEKRLFFDKGDLRIYD